MKSLISAVLLVSAAYGDVVTDWNAVMLATVRPQGAHIQSRIAAVTHIAMHDAVNSITNEYRTYGGRIYAGQPYGLRQVRRRHTCPWLVQRPLQPPRIALPSAPRRRLSLSS